MGSLNFFLPCLKLGCICIIQITKHLIIILIGNIHWYFLSVKQDMVSITSNVDLLSSHYKFSHPYLQILVSLSRSNSVKRHACVSSHFVTIAASPNQMRWLWMADLLTSYFDRNAWNTSHQCQLQNQMFLWNGPINQQASMVGGFLFTWLFLSRSISKLGRQDVDCGFAFVFSWIKTLNVLFNRWNSTKTPHFYWKFETPYQTALKV